jgi:hypothetical protein
MAHQSISYTPPCSTLHRLSTSHTPPPQSQIEMSDQYYKLFQRGHPSKPPRATFNISNRHTQSYECNTTENSLSVRDLGRSSSTTRTEDEDEDEEARCKAELVHVLQLSLHETHQRYPDAAAVHRPTDASHIRPVSHQSLSVALSSGHRSTAQNWPGQMMRTTTSTLGSGSVASRLQTSRKNINNAEFNYTARKTNWTALVSGKPPILSAVCVYLEKC